MPQTAASGVGQWLSEQAEYINEKVDYIYDKAKWGVQVVGRNVRKAADPVNHPGVCRAVDTALHCVPVPGLPAAYRVAIDRDRKEAEAHAKALQGMLDQQTGSIKEDLQEYDEGIHAAIAPVGRAALKAASRSGLAVITSAISGAINGFQIHNVKKDTEHLLEDTSTMLAQQSQIDERTTTILTRQSTQTAVLYALAFRAVVPLLMSPLNMLHQHSKNQADLATNSTECPAMIRSLQGLVSKMGEYGDAHCAQLFNGLLKDLVLWAGRSAQLVEAHNQMSLLKRKAHSYFFEREIRGCFVQLKELRERIEFVLVLDIRHLQHLQLRKSDDLRGVVDGVSQKADDLRGVVNGVSQKADDLRGVVDSVSIYQVSARDSLARLRTDITELQRQQARQNKILGAIVRRQKKSDKQLQEIIGLLSASRQ